MKRNFRKNSPKRSLLWIGSMALACMIALCGFNSGMLAANRAYAEAASQVLAAEPAYDPSPAIYVSQKNANSVVGVITNTQQWDRSSGEVKETLYSQGSGVVIMEGGYVLTNYHVIEGGDSYQILMPNGEKAEATVAGSDSSLDLAVMKVDSKYADQLVPVTIGSSSDLLVGSTVIAIGNPSGEVLANTVTQGIVSALERSEVSSSNTTRSVDYIQHDAAINSGNSGGGLFNYKGELVGINTLKYGGSVYSSVSVEGLGFAIPVDTAYPIAMQLVEKGEVIRPQMGITVADMEGPDEPMSNYPPASVCIRTVEENSPAEKAGLKQYDFIYAINGERVTNFRELTSILDKHQAGDIVTVTVVRYANAFMQTQNNYNNYYDDMFGRFFGGYGYGYGNGGNYNNNQNSSSTEGQLVVGGGYEFINVDVTLELPEEK
ncbi:MAG: trypsin-like peptidase domain-containing protein [Clostridia bacterium]|nr:trypsin-like peptidase domain-containing protein [Clostridia bacterium]